MMDLISTILPADEPTLTVILPVDEPTLTVILPVDGPTLAVTLPIEIFVNILNKIHVIDRIILRSVSKLWLSIIDSKYVKGHANNIFDTILTNNLGFFNNYECELNDNCSIFLSVNKKKIVKKYVICYELSKYVDDKTMLKYFKFNYLVDYYYIGIKHIIAWFSENNYDSIVSYLIGRAKIFTINYKLPFLLAIKSNNIKIVELFKINKLVTQKMINNGLFYAILIDDPTMIYSLIQCNINYNYDLILFALYHNKINSIKFLIKNIPNINFESCIRMAISKNNFDMVKVLLKESGMVNSIITLPGIAKSVVLNKYDQKKILKMCIRFHDYETMKYFKKSYNNINLQCYLSKKQDKILKIIRRIV